MKLLTLCLYASIGLRQSFSVEVVCPPVELTWEQKVEQHLIMCVDRPWLPPHTNKSESVYVGLVFSMEHFDYLSSVQQLYVYTRTAIYWNDTRLRWDPSKFNGIEKTTQHSFMIWTPNIILLNNINDYDKVKSIDALCEISSSGHVKCISEMFFNTPCIADLKEWPRDVQTCHLEIGAWDLQQKKTNIHLFFLPEESVTMFEDDIGTEWDIYFKWDEDDSNEMQLKMSFTFERRAEVLVALVIYPSVILSALTLSTVVLDVRRNLRLYVTCFSLICNFYFQSNLAMEIPKHCNNPPNILLFSRGLIIMNGLNVALTILMKTLCVRDAPVSTWIALTNDYVFTSFGKYVIVPRWKIENFNVQQRENVKGWTDFTNLLNTVWMYVCVVVYIILYYAYVPCKIP